MFKLIKNIFNKLFKNNKNSDTANSTKTKKKQFVNADKFNKCPICGRKTLVKNHIKLYKPNSEEVSGHKYSVKCPKCKRHIVCKQDTYIDALNECLDIWNNTTIKNNKIKSDNEKVKDKKKKKNKNKNVEPTTNETVA